MPIFTKSFRYILEKQKYELETVFAGSMNPEKLMRTYSDFVWLQAELIRDFPGVIVPALPEKDLLMKVAPTITGDDQGSARYNQIEVRKMIFQMFLNHLVASPTLKHSADFRAFLTKSETVKEASANAAYQITALLLVGATSKCECSAAGPDSGRKKACSPHFS